jgi:hypothetical protein
MGEAGVKQANGCRIFIEDQTRPVTVGMDQVKATWNLVLELWIFQD